MLRYRLGTLLILLAIGPPMMAGVWFAARSSGVTMNPETIVTTNDFAAIVDSEHAILHIDVDWAMQAIQSRPTVAELQSRLDTDPVLHNVRFGRVDCSGQEGVLWEYLLEWCRTNQLDTARVFGGYGALVWIERGQVRDSVQFAAEHTVDDLHRKTAKAFSTK